MTTRRTPAPTALLLAALATSCARRPTAAARGDEEQERADGREPLLHQAELAPDVDQGAVEHRLDEGAHGREGQKPHELAGASKPSLRSRFHSSRPGRAGGSVSAVCSSDGRVGSSARSLAARSPRTCTTTAA